MEWLKNEKELFQFLSDMKRKNQVANLDNYIKWIKDQSVQIKQDRESGILNIKIAVTDKQNNILIY
ncbi:MULTISPECIES: hypothetical protein [Enterococcus]|uniref:hypothetical protein n=1 Tax=Enterococcus TaxID=1350 RepID=UPI0001B2E080|nr:MULTISPECIES: hypothetical protein [Enterococcus]EEU75537.1 predicted protein [Enterococcus faecalis JH1]MBD9751734.1 hypothetical protein [Enterococcus faecium]TKN38437.1 hypothetical protein DVW97_06220 [Enterococcus faecium]TKN56324.1 hypothetical protein DVX18_04930 [Enterococcus faecium]TKN58125.1 hypothetical protein DVX16_04930 [Enterococcus faecium]